jgi:hypothetical protein
MGSLESIRLDAIFTIHAEETYASFADLFTSSSYLEGQTIVLTVI